jgi:hypothetical protein
MTIEAMKLALEALETVAVDVTTTPNAYEAQRQATAALRAAIEQAEKTKPVAWMYVNTDGECEQIEYNKDWPMPDDPALTPLYAAPRKWQGLTKREFLEAVDGLEDLEDCWVAIEAKLKDKNG